MVQKLYYFFETEPVPIEPEDRGSNGEGLDECVEKDP